MPLLRLSAISKKSNFSLSAFFENSKIFKIVLSAFFCNFKIVPSAPFCVIQKTRKRHFLRLSVPSAVSVISGAIGLSAPISAASQAENSRPLPSAASDWPFCSLLACHVPAAPGPPEPNCTQFVCRCTQFPPDLLRIVTLCDMIGGGKEYFKIDG